MTQIPWLNPNPIPFPPFPWSEHNFPRLTPMLCPSIDFQPSATRHFFIQYVSLFSWSSSCFLSANAGLHLLLPSYLLSSPLLLCMWPAPYIITILFFFSPLLFPLPLLLLLSLWLVPSVTILSSFFCPFSPPICSFLLCFLCSSQLSFSLPSLPSYHFLPFNLPLLSYLHCSISLIPLPLSSHSN